VSKAREDLPDPDKPVITIRLSRGIDKSMFLRLWTLAPLISMLLSGSELFSGMIFDKFRGAKLAHFYQDEKLACV
jgi:hypothetical protein